MSEPRGSSFALVGYRGTGKTTVGRLLAERLGWRFVDADQRIEAIAGRPIAAIFAERGEPAFRDLEQSVLAELATADRLVLATGGGAVVRPANRPVLRRFGCVAWLTADPAVLADRLRAEADNRPALTAAGTLGEIADVLAARTPFYREVADVTVGTDGLSPAEIAESILRSDVAAGLTRE